jgi:UDP-N-acetylmuramate: L-alanyl-gamma-D-glutamyl-meso-diaminopimelate ligase
VLTNLEYDHADIFPDLAAIQRQVHHLIRTVPGRGAIIAQAGSQAIDEVLAMGCWTAVSRFGAAGGSWRAQAFEGTDGFAVTRDGEVLGEVRWQIPGAHNRDNAIAAIAAAQHGVPVSRRWRRSHVSGVNDGPSAPTSRASLYDDFAHHPTEITASLAALRTRAARLIAVLEPRSHSVSSARIAPASPKRSPQPIAPGCISRRISPGRSTTWRHRSAPLRTSPVTSMASYAR